MDLDDANNRIAVGIPFDTKVELTRATLKDANGAPDVNRKVFVDYLKLSHIDTGPYNVDLYDRRFGRNKNYPIRSSLGETLGTVDSLTDTGSTQVLVRGRAEDTTITISNTSHLNSRVAGVSQMITAIPS